jgi:hypothetical protein
MQRHYKKMAGTSAVFVSADHNGASPVERDGMVWTEAELGLDNCNHTLHWREPIDSSLALEGLEEYDAPQHGDARYVNKLKAAFVYLEKIKGWVEITGFG